MVTTAGCQAQGEWNTAACGQGLQPAAPGAAPGLVAALPCPSAAFFWLRKGPFEKDACCAWLHAALQQLVGCRAYARAWRGVCDPVSLAPLVAGCWCLWEASGQPQGIGVRHKNSTMIFSVLLQPPSVYFPQVAEVGMGFVSSRLSLLFHLPSFLQLLPFKRPAPKISRHASPMSSGSKPMLSHSFLMVLLGSQAGIISAIKGPLCDQEIILTWQRWGSQHECKRQQWKHLCFGCPYAFPHGLKRQSTENMCGVGSHH